MKLSSVSPAFALGAFVLILGFSPIVGKLSVSVISPVFLVFVSCIIGFLLFTPWLIRNKKFPALFAKKEMLSFLIIGTFGTALPFCILLYSLRFTTPANLAILNQAEMLYSLLLSYILLKEIPSVKQLFASALILLGVTAILFEGKLSINKGDIIVLSCLWMFQISHIAAKKLPREMPHALISAAKNFYSLPILVLLLCLSGGMFIKWNTDLFIVLGFTGIIRYGLSTLLWFIAIRSMHLAKATAIALSFPALTLLISVALGYDTLNAYKVAGLALTMAGAWWLNTIAGQKAQG